MKKTKKTVSAITLVFFLAPVFGAGILRSAAAQNGEVRLEIHTLSETVKSRLKIAGWTAPGVSVKMYVNGSDQGRVKVGRRGKISKWVVLPAIGTNEILVTAESQAESNSATRYVERKAVKAVDKPLFLKIIHSKNETKNSVLEIWGMAYGVSRVQVLINETEWGWTVVNTWSGKYKTKVRLSEGLNTVKVTVSKDDETITVTKNVDKI